MIVIILRLDFVQSGANDILFFFEDIIQNIDRFGKSYCYCLV